VFAAASLTDSLKAIAECYHKRTGDRIIFNFAASSTLAFQIEEGAPADIFFCADDAQMDRLEAIGLILKQTRKSRLSNSLVIIVAAESGAAVSAPKGLAGPAVKRLALGDPQAVPIGIYAKEYLESIKLWPEISPKLVITENVRAALAAVESGDADASIVYKTDAATSKKVKVVFEVPAKEGPKISYPVALVRDASDRKAAKQFLDQLSSQEAGVIFRKYGFIVLPAEPGL
jgi:molybdate transport system substrate-binding protein